MRTQVDTAYGPQLFTAKPDIVVVKAIEAATDECSRGEIHIKVVDYKSTGEIGHDLIEAKLDHQLQVNMYAWVAGRELPMHLGLFPQDWRVVVDELEVVYVSMKKVRRFTSAGQRTTKGKMLTRRPPTYADLTLEPIMLLPPGEVEGLVRGKIEERLRAKEELPDMLEGDAAWRCDFCPVFNLCREIGNLREAA